MEALWEYPGGTLVTFSQFNANNSPGNLRGCELEFRGTKGTLLIQESQGFEIIPEKVRNDLGLNEGDQFVVIGQGDAVILKVITPPKLEEFQERLSQARAEAKKAGVKKADLKSAIARVRRRAK